MSSSAAPNAWVTLLGAAILVAVSSCVGVSVGESRERAKESARQRAEAAKKPPKPKLPKVLTHQVELGQVVVLDIPTRMQNVDFWESRRCYVWRDAEFKSSTMSCESSSDMILDDN